MSTRTFADEELDLAAVRRRVDSTLAGVLGPLPAEYSRWFAGHGDPVAVLNRYVTAPGKRIRPVLCVLGWHAAGGSCDESDGTDRTRSVLCVAASLELFHVFALIHDDVMDGGDTRRGLPSVHRAMAELGPSGTDAGWFGSSAAVLLGDLALIRSDRTLHAAGLDAGQLKAVLPLLDAMRDEAFVGQYLDLLATGPPTENVERAVTVARLKTAKYTVERPLQIGAAVAGAGAAVLDACSAYALPLGEAFQLRDDLLGVFGRPGVTGKPVLADLRSGKRTALMALAVQHASAAQRRLLAGLVGDPGLDEQGADAVREVLEATGARGAVEDMIAARHREALAALGRAPFPPGAVAALRELADGAVLRTS